MNEPPPLPDGDDPHRLLGVSWGAGAQEVRRAYVRLIRLYRPETHPEEFARIRAAYERLGVGQGVVQPSFEGVSSPTAAPTPASPADPRWETVSKGWAALAEGEPETARAVLARCQEEHPDWAPGAVHRFLLEEALGSPPDAILPVLGRAFSAGAPVAAAVRDLLDERELRALLSRPECAWATLRRQPDRAAAAGLLRVRHRALLLEGREDELFDDLAGEAFQSDALDSTDLAWVAREGMAVAAWDRPEVAEELRRVFATEEQAGSDLLPEDHYAEAVGLSPDFLRWREGCEAPRLLDRFLRVSPVLDLRDARTLAADLYAEFVQAPLEWLHALTGLQRTSGGLVDRYVRTLRGTLDPYEAEDSDDPPSVDRERILRGLAEVDRRMRPPRVRPWMPAVAILVAAVILPVWTRTAWPLLLALLSAPVALLLRRRAARSRDLRELLALLILESSVSPEVLAGTVRASPVGFSQRLISELPRLTHDSGLDAFTQTRRIGSLLTARG